MPLAGTQKHDLIVWRSDAIVDGALGRELEEIGEFFI